MTITNLPRDLLEEIIYRVPLKCLKAVQLTCKRWNFLSKRKSFAKMQLSNAATKRRQGDESMMIAYADTSRSFYLISVVVDVDPSIKLEGKLHILKDKVSIYRVYHYEGLLLCILEDTPKILVLNPYLRQTRWIKLRYSHLPNGYNRYSYALGYKDKKSCRSVKLLRFIDSFHEEALEMQFFWYEIYDFDSGLWTSLDVDSPHWAIYCSSLGVSIKGNSYWIASKRTSIHNNDYLICFDFTRERFGPLLPLPSCIRDRRYAYETLSCVKEEKLAALFQHHLSYEHEFEIWVTTKIEAETVSWSKFLRIDRRPGIYSPHTFFVEEEKKVFMSFCTAYKSNCDDDNGKSHINIIGEAGYIKKMDLRVSEDLNRWPKMCDYVPSSVRIKKRGKRQIKESSLEKRRFDHNMAKLAVTDKLHKESRSYWW